MHSSFNIRNSSFFIRHSSFTLLPIEKIALAWTIIITILTAAMWPHLTDPATMLWTSLAWAIITALIVIIFRQPTPTSHFLRTAAQLAWLPTWYPQTFQLNRWRDNLDHIFAQADWNLFHCQPSLEFSRHLTGPVWSELFNLGYISYFPMIALLIIAVAWRANKRPNGQMHNATPSHVGALVLTSFFIYYALFILIPVGGPQFYFPIIGIDNAEAGIYPHIGTAFNDAWQMKSPPGWHDGLFHRLVALAQATGERPTAAFPSSHIAISTIVLILAWRHIRAIVPVLLPLWLFLCCATVYIRAHYLVDAIAGLLSAPLVLALAALIVRKIERNFRSVEVQK